MSKEIQVSETRQLAMPIELPLTVRKIEDIAINNYPSLRTLSASIEGRKKAKLALISIVEKYSDSDLLPLPAPQLAMIVNWILEDFNPQTGQGGCLNYTIPDIHFVFQKGLTGQFGKPSGHKYVMPEIIGRGGWFDQYDDIRRVELGNFYWAKNDEKVKTQNLIEARSSKNNISYEKYLEGLTDEEKERHDEQRAKMENIGKGKRKESKRVFLSIEDYCAANGLVYEAFLRPRVTQWIDDYAGFEEKVKKSIKLENYVKQQSRKLLIELNKN